MTIAGRKWAAAALEIEKSGVRTVKDMSAELNKLDPVKPEGCSARYRSAVKYGFNFDSKIDLRKENVGRRENTDKKNLLIAEEAKKLIKSNPYYKELGLQRFLRDLKAILRKKEKALGVDLTGKSNSSASLVSFMNAGGFRWKDY